MCVHVTVKGICSVNCVTGNRNSACVTGKKDSSVTARVGISKTTGGYQSH